MKTKWMMTLAAVAMCLWTTQGALAQDHKGHDHAGHDHAGHDHAGHDHVGHDHGQPQFDPATMPGMTPEVMKWMEANKKSHANPMIPGAAHEELKHFVGSWDLTVKFWMGGPGTPASESKGTAEIKPLFGGRYYQENMTSNFTMGPGMEMDFKGQGTFGYDNYKNMYVGTWVDNMGTQIFTYKGMRNPMTGVFTYYGDMDEPMLNVSGRTVKMTTTVKDKDNHVFEWYDLHAGDDYKVMEIVYKRKK